MRGIRIRACRHAALTGRKKRKFVVAEFSVIIASVNGLPSIGECLASMENQRGGIDTEIVVVDAAGAETRKFIRKNFPNVRLIECEGRVGIPEMRAIGMRTASGRFFVVTEDHCIAPPNWIEEMQKAHAAGYAVVGGTVENGSRGRLTDWAVFLCEYSGFMPPIRDGEAEFVAGNNVSYERAVIEQIDESIKNNLWEYFLQAELKRNGVRFLAASAIEVLHKKEFGFFYFLSQRFHYSRSFAAMRSSRSTSAGKLIYLAYSPVSAFHLTWRIVANVLRKRKYRKELLLSLPFLAAFMCAYAIGEFVGQVFGPGDSLSRVE